MKLTGAEILLESLIKEGVEVIFGITGGAIMPVYHHLPKYKKLHHITTRHEQAAAHAADGYARASGKVGVCMSTSGPGATNLVTGIANAYLDSIPLVAITGQVAIPLIGSDAFQETDITGVTLPITKHNFLVTKIKDLAETIKAAFHLAKTGRPGPVLIDLPKDIQLKKTKFIYPKSLNLPGFKPQFEGNPLQIKKAVHLLNKAKRPVILAGHGVLISQTSKELKRLASKGNIPVTNTLLGLSSFPQVNPLYLGMAGMHGSIAANKASFFADCIFACGMRFDDRITGKLAKYAPKAKVIHLDIDPAEIGKNVQVEIPIVGDIKKVLSKMIPLIKKKRRKNWFSQIKKWKRLHQRLYKPKPKGPTGKLSAAFIIETLSQVTKGKANIVADVGQNQMFTACYYKFAKTNSHFSAGGLGPMGFALPASLGVKMAKPNQEVWAIAGDGGFQMTNQELITLVQEKLDVKIAILNNSYLGMVRQWQQLFFEKNYSQTFLLNPDFVKIAKASGIPAEKVKKASQVKKAILRARRNKGPYLLEFIQEPEENIFPMVPSGASINEMIMSNNGVSTSQVKKASQGNPEQIASQFYRAGTSDGGTFRNSRLIKEIKLNKKWKV